jgi:hypothetical protein
VNFLSRFGGVGEKVRILGIWGEGVRKAKKIEKSSFFRGQIEIILSIYMREGNLLFIFIRLAPLGLASVTGAPGRV